MIKNTEIYKGMKKIDDDLGGTTPLDIIIKFPVKKVEKSDDDFEEWEEESNGINLLIGLQGIKSIKF